MMKRVCTWHLHLGSIEGLAWQNELDKGSVATVGADCVVNLFRLVGLSCDLVTGSEKRVYSTECNLNQLVNLRNKIYEGLKAEVKIRGNISIYYGNSS